MPLLAGSLLWLNGRDAWTGGLRNGRGARAALWLALLLFAAIALRGVLDR